MALVMVAITPALVMVGVLASIFLQRYNAVSTKAYAGVGKQQPPLFRRDTCSRAPALCSNLMPHLQGLPPLQMPTPSHSRRLPTSALCTASTAKSAPLRPMPNPWKSRCR